MAEAEAASMLLAFATFLFLPLITPRPDMMLQSSGATFDLRRTIPHVVGISDGCAVMVVVIGRIGGITDALPLLCSALNVAPTAYLLWLASRIANRSGEASERRKSLARLATAGCQCVNLKAWAIALGAVTNFARPAHPATE